MKTLWLIRHAKSSWDIGRLEDIDRPLNERGYSDAYDMAKRVKKQAEHSLLVTSPAIRALSTALIFARTLGKDAAEVLLRSNLYDTPVDAYLSVIGSLPDEHAHVLLFGHNPVITETANLLAGTTFDDVPTAGVIGITFEERTWKKAALAGGKLAFYDFPKNRAGV